MAPEELEEEFSFSTTTNTPPRFIGSPPLWRSPSPSPNSCSKSFREKERRRRRSLSSYIDHEEDEEEEEKMDVLWVDLNALDEKREEENYRISSNRGSQVKLGLNSVQFRSQSSLRLSKSSSIVVTCKRPLVFLKKLFLLHNTNSTTRHPWVFK